MIIHNSEQFSQHLDLAYSLIDTVIAALDHPDCVANRRSLIDCLELSGFHIQQLQEEIKCNSQTVVLPETTLLETDDDKFALTILE